jgi:hypothetical protein
MALADNIWWTRRARIKTEKRLLSNAFQSQVLLLWYSFFGVAVSIYYLKCPQIDSNGLANISWVVYSVLILCISGFINGFSFKERAGLIKECYETLNGLYHCTKKDSPNIDALTKDYNQVLGVCENHTNDDYYRALCEEYITHQDPKGTKNVESKLDRLPTKYHWLMVSWSKAKRFMVLSFLYLLPLLLFCLLKKHS